jgi:hypothetical protein
VVLNLGKIRVAMMNFGVLLAMGWIPPTNGYRSAWKSIGPTGTIYELIEEPNDIDKLGQGFMSVDPLEKVDI